MTYTINPNAKDVWIRDNEDTMDLSPITDASSVYLENGRTIEQELGEGSMVSNIATVDTSMSKVIDGTLDGAYESCLLKGRTLVNVLGSCKFSLAKTEEGKSVTRYIPLNPLIKPNTKYLYVINVLKNTLTRSDNGSAMKYCETDSSKVSSSTCWGWMNHIYPGFTGVKKHIMTTKPVFEGVCELSDRIEIYGSTDVGGVIEFETFVIEYQEGMENWDIPYFEGMCDVKMPILRNVGKNLANQSKYEIEAYVGGNDGVTVAIGSASKNTQSIIMEIEPNVSIVASSSSNSDRKVLACFNHFPTNGSKATKKTNNGYITTDTDTKYVMYYYNSNTVANGIVSQVQIEESPSPTQYEPYKTNILHTPEIVTLRSLPNGVRDELNLKTGEYIKRIGEVVLNGSEDWKAWESNDTHCKLSLANYPSNMRLNGQHTTRLVCDKLKIGSDRVGVVNDNFMASVGDAAYTIIVGLELGKLTSANVAGFKQWLKENPLTVQYELATPITTKVTLTQSEPIVKIGTELPNGVCDTYNLLTGEHIQRVGKVVLDGSEVWKNASLTSNNGQYYVSYCPLSSMKKYTMASGVISLTSDKFVAEPPVGDDEAKRRDREFIASYGSNATVVDGESNWIYLSVEKGKIASNTGTAFANYLKSNPVTVWYELKNPIVTKKNGLPNTHGVTLPSGVVDKYNESTGVYTQNVGVEYVGDNGTFDNIIQQSNGTRIHYNLGESIRPIRTKVLTDDRFTFKDTWSETYEPYSVFIGSGLDMYFVIPTSEGVTTIAQAKDWFEANKTLLYYELATPKTIDIPLINVGQVLSNGVCDTYNPITKEYVKRVGQGVLDGTEENWILANNELTNTVRFATLSAPPFPDAKVLGSIISNLHFGNELSYENDKELIEINSGKDVVIRISRARLSSPDLDGFKKWIKKNPLTVWYELENPITSTVDLDLSTLYSSSPIAYENGHVILESGHNGQSLLPTLEYSTITNRVKQIESIGEQVLRQEKQLTMLEQMLIQNIIGLDYNNTVLALNLEIDEVI